MMIKILFLAAILILPIPTSAHADDGLSKETQKNYVELEDMPKVPGGAYDRFGWGAAAKLTYKALVPRGLDSTAVVYAHQLPANLSPTATLAAIRGGLLSGKLKWARIGEDSGKLEVPTNVTLLKPEDVEADAAKLRIVSFASELLPGYDTGARKWVTFDMKSRTRTERDPR